MAACAAAQDAIWLIKLLKELGSIFTKPLSSIMFSTLVALFTYFTVNVVLKAVGYLYSTVYLYLFL
jgi:hypothetical protein